MNQLLLCTDLDRTLLPNGTEPESERARPIFKRLAERGDVTLVYATGRHQELVEQAISEYQLPQPDYVIADVGASIYRVDNKLWTFLSDWEDVIKRDWRGQCAGDFQTLFADIDHLELQEASKQSAYKLSYYIPAHAHHKNIIDNMKIILSRNSIAAQLIWSTVQHTDIGLLDVLPASAGKLHALEFLMQKLSFGLSQTVFAGDSGNDLAVLCSAVPSVLVANADDELRRNCLCHVNNNQQGASLYLARGDFMGMNGNYSAGIVEGVAHFMPHIKRWLDTEVRVT